MPLTEAKRARLTEGDLFTNNQNNIIMVKYNLQLNNGVEAFGTTGKTITANEVVETCDAAELAREIAHYAEVVNERTCKFVLDNLLAACVQKMSEGKAVVLTLDGKAALRIYPDVRLKAGSINLAKAKELDKTVTDLTMDNISDLATKAGGVVLRAKAEVEQPMTDALLKMGASVHMDGKKEIARILRKENQGEGGNTGGGTQGGGSSPDELP